MADDQREKRGLIARWRVRRAHRAEQAAQTFCGPPSVDDEAMLTLLRKHSAEDASR